MNSKEINCPLCKIILYEEDLEQHFCKIHNPLKNYRLIVMFLEKKIKEIEKKFPFRANLKMYEEFCDIKKKIINVEDRALESFISQYSQALHQVYIHEYRKIKIIFNKIEKYSFDKKLEKLSWIDTSEMTLKDYNFQFNLFKIEYEYEMIHQWISSIKMDEIRNLQDLYLMQLQKLEGRLKYRDFNSDDYL